MATNKIFLLCKGADSIIEALLDQEKPENDVTDLM
jgi:hypothetical protein